MLTPMAMPTCGELQSTAPLDVELLVMLVACAACTRDPITTMSDVHHITNENAACHEDQSHHRSPHYSQLSCFGNSCTLTTLSDGCTFTTPLLHSLCR